MPMAKSISGSVPVPVRVIDADPDVPVPSVATDPDWRKQADRFRKQRAAPVSGSHPQGTPIIGRKPRRVCARKGCKTPLVDDNDTGYCKHHQNGNSRDVKPKPKQRQQYSEGRVCSDPDCDTVITNKNKSGLCQKHHRLSYHRFKEAKAAKTRLDTVKPEYSGDIGIVVAPVPYSTPASAPLPAHISDISAVETVLADARAYREIKPEIDAIFADLADIQARIQRLVA